MSYSVVWGLILAIHLVSIMLWLGGTAYAAFILKPSLSLLDATQRNSVALQTLKRFFRVIWLVVPATLLSGWIMVIRYGGFEQLPLLIDIMQGLAILMAAVLARCFFGPYKKFMRAIRPQPALFISITRQMYIVLGLGILAVVSGALVHMA